MESIQLLPDGSAQTETPADQNTDTPEKQADTAPENAIELTPPDATCPKAKDDEIQVWLSPKKDNAFLIAKAGPKGASSAVRFTIPPFWVPTPSILWSDEKGEFAAKLTLDLRADQEIFVQADAWCRQFNVSLIADRMRERYLESISIPVLQVGQTTTIRLRLLGTPTSDPKAFSSHPQIAQIQSIKTQRDAQETVLSTEVKGQAKGNFTLLVFDPSAFPFTVQLTVE